MHTRPTKNRQVTFHLPSKTENPSRPDVPHITFLQPESCPLRVRGWNLSLALTHHYSEELVNSVFLHFSFFCTELNHKLGSVLHANKTFGCLITAKAMNNLVCPLLCSLNVNNKQTNPTRWSYYVQNVIWLKSLWDEAEDPWGPSRRGEHRGDFSLRRVGAGLSLKITAFLPFKCQSIQVLIVWMGKKWNVYVINRKCLRWALHSEAATTAAALKTEVSSMKAAHSFRTCSGLGLIRCSQLPGKLCSGRDF